jgi:hypothetical protein
MLIHVCPSCGVEHEKESTPEPDQLCEVCLSLSDIGMHKSDADKMFMMIDEAEDALDDVFHRYGYVLDHSKIRNKIRELVENV